MTCTEGCSPYIVHDNGTTECLTYCSYDTKPYEELDE